MSTRLLRNLVRRCALVLALLLASLQMAAALAACHGPASGTVAFGVAPSPCGDLDSAVSAICEEARAAPQHGAVSGDTPHDLSPAAEIRPLARPPVERVLLLAEFHPITPPLHLLYGRLLN